MLSQVNASQNRGIEYNFSVHKRGELKTVSLNLYTTMNIMLCTPNPKTNELAVMYLSTESRVCDPSREKQLGWHHHFNVLITIPDGSTSAM